MIITHESSLENYTSQLRYAIDNYTNHGIDIKNVKNIVLGGLGGSGIAGAIAKGYFFDKIAVSIEAVNDYALPAYVNSDTLVILNSYSGNTEETLSLYAQAKESGAQMLALSAGGKITALCAEDGVKCYPIETGFQPRMTIGYGLTYMLLILGELNGQDLRSTLQEVAEKMDEKQSHQMESAATIFDYFKTSLKHKFVILADAQMYAIAIRFAQQINENAKLEAFVHPVPECNHNVIESYTDRLQTNFVFLHSEVNPRISARLDFLSGHLEMDNNKVLPLVIPEYDIYTIYDIIYRLDWVSVMMANEIGAPLMEIPVIADLKDFLSNLEMVDHQEEEAE